MDMYADLLDLELDDDMTVTLKHDVIYTARYAAGSY